MAQIECLIVTPETTAFEQTVDSVVVPLLDGELGILPGHAPMIGRLGPGELRVNTGSDSERFYVDGGFVQIADNVVSVLTGYSARAADLDVARARADLEEAQSMNAIKPEDLEAKRKAVAQAKAQIRICQNS